MQQQPAGTLVDVLGGGDQADAQFVEASAQGGVVVAVAHQAVEFVDDDVVDGASGGGLLLQVGQHGLQGGSSGGGGGYAALDEFLGDDGAHGEGLALVGRSLGGDGESLVPSAAPGLFAGGYPQVGYCSFGGQGLAHGGQGVGGR